MCSTWPCGIQEVQVGKNAPTRQSLDQLGGNEGQFHIFYAPLSVWVTRESYSPGKWGTSMLCVLLCNWATLSALQGFCANLKQGPIILNQIIAEICIYLKHSPKNSTYTTMQLTILLPWNCQRPLQITNSSRNMGFLSKRLSQPSGLSKMCHKLSSSQFVRLHVCRVLALQLYNIK